MSKLFTQKGLNLLMMGVDLIIVYLSIVLAYLFFEDSLENYQNNYYAFISISPYIGIAYFILAHIFELDKPKDFSLFGIVYTVSLIVLCLSFSTMAFSFLTREFAYPRSILIASSVLQILLLSPWHLFLNRRYLKSSISKTAIVIGYDKTKFLAQKILTSEGISSKIKYICNPNHSNLKSLINDCDVVFLAEDIDELKKQEIIEYCIIQRRNIYYEPRNSEILLFNASLTQIDDTPVLKVKPLGLSPESLFLKRGLDLFLSVLALIVFCIPILIISLSLKIGGGSIFYRQERVTKGGQVFQIFKFRTMIENAEALSGPVLAQDVDPRITKLGHIMRATRLDEIPQIFNILMGDMSIVGPRPERPFFVDQFNADIPEYRLRHSLKAGLTGFAQVNGKYNTSVQNKLKYDLLYVNNYSLTLDIKLIMQTLNILLRKSSTEGLKDAIDIEKEIEKLIQKDSTNL